MNVPRTSVGFGDDLVQALHDLGFLVAIETNGRLLVPAGVVTGFASANRAALAFARGHELKIRVAAAGSSAGGSMKGGSDDFCFGPQTALTPSTICGRRRVMPDSSEMANQRAIPQTSRHQMKISQVFKSDCRSPSIATHGLQSSTSIRT